MEKTIKITEDYVSFETAKLLKKKGFDALCTMIYTANGELLYTDVTHNNMYAVTNKQLEYYTDILAPSQTMAMKWLREQNKIISILHSYVTNKYRIIITQFNKLDIANLNNTLYISNDYDYFSYEEACEAAIKYCCENLI